MKTLDQLLDEHGFNQATALNRITREQAHRVAQAWAEQEGAVLRAERDLFHEMGTKENRLRAKAEAELSALRERVKLVPHIVHPDDYPDSPAQVGHQNDHAVHDAKVCREEHGQCAFAAAAQAVEPQKGE